MDRAPSAFRILPLDVTHKVLTTPARVDWNRVAQRPVNALWINEVDAAGFYSLLADTVARLP